MINEVTEDLKILFEMTNNKISRLKVAKKNLIRGMITGLPKK